VPSAFGAAQRAATAAAATAAGLPQVTIVDEPLATAWAYTSFGNVGARYAAVYDLGGGTFDLAVLDCAEPPFRVLATGGDPYLGGDDIDVRLADHAAATLLTEHGWDVRSDPEAFDRLLVECERAKIRLSFAPRTTLALGEVDPGAPIATATFTLERDLLERLCYDLVQRTFSVCDEVLHRAGVRAQDLGAVFLAGGSTSLPSVRAGVERYFGRPPRQEFDPMEVLAIGSSLMQ
jgi:molecular chaperone DnaK